MSAVTLSEMSMKSGVFHHSNQRMFTIGCGQALAKRWPAVVGPERPQICPLPVIFPRLIARRSGPRQWQRGAPTSQPELQAAGCKSLRAIAAGLDARCIPASGWQVVGHTGHSSARARQRIGSANELAALSRQARPPLSKAVRASASSKSLTSMARGYSLHTV